ncbi:SDR family NAD(P)-dependent oxidoreductase, partial [Mycobacterium sp. PS03-16]|uniref:beta-ketoacyl reductase n=1 Tax=Mycobacterium sp. PS03-16 TaxID=2559611 RepID=UPI001072F23B
VGTLARDTDDTLTFHTNLNTTHTTHPPQTPHPPEPHPQLPTTPWHHTRHWIEFAPRSAAQIATHRDSAAQAGGVIPAEWNCELTWMPSTTGDPVADLDASWLVIGDRALGDEIGRLMAAGHRVMVIPPSMLLGESGRRTLGAEISTATRVIYAPEVPSDPSDPAAARHVFEAARTLVTHLAASATPAQLFLLTRNAQPIAVGDRANPAHAVLWGLGRTLALEHPDIWGKVIDIDESVPDQRAARYLLAEADPSDDDDQVVYRAGTRHVPRLRPPADAQTKAAGRLDADVAHLVVGATGNIGPHLVQQLADMGARTVVAVSRNPGGRLDRLTASLAERGVTVVTVAADAADETAMAVLFDRFGADLPPLGGIYLAAFGGGPVMLTEMTDDDVTTMFRPKIDAAIVLHRLSVRQPVQQFVLFTSISGIIGSRWLAHYTATTTFLDTLAYARRAAGLPATAINWGFWKSLADNQSEEYRQVTLDSGLEPMPDEVAIQALWSVTGPDAPTRATVVAADWTRLGTAYRTRTALHIIDDLVTADADDTDTDDDWHGIAGITEMDAAAARQIVSDRLLARLAGVLGYTDHSALNVTAPLIEFGMDSLMAVRIRQAMKKDFGVEPPVGMLLQGGTLTDVIDDVMTQLGVDEPGPTVVDAFRAKTNQRAAARRDASLRRRKGQLL